MSEIKFMPFLKGPADGTDHMGERKEKLPMELGILINRYVDPFLGRGHILFDVMSVPGMTEAVVSDINSEIINTYRQVQCHVDDLLDELQVMENKFAERTYEEKAAYYKTILFRYRHLCESARTDIDMQKAAMYIFLNAAEYITQICGDGYTVSSRGTKIILPAQAMKLTRVCDERTLRICSKLLKNVKILCCDFRGCLEYVNNKTLLYLDPPSAKSQKKTAYSFTEKDRQSVLSICKIARSLGAMVLSKDTCDKQKQAHENHKNHTRVDKHGSKSHT